MRRKALVSLMKSRRKGRSVVFIFPDVISEVILHFPIYLVSPWQRRTCDVIDSFFERSDVCVVLTGSVIASAAKKKYY